MDNDQARSDPPDDAMTGWSPARWRLTMGPEERKVVIALAVSGEAERFPDLVEATGLDAGKLEIILADLAARGVVTLVEEDEVGPVPSLQPDIAIVPTETLSIAVPDLPSVPPAAIEPVQAPDTGAECHDILDDEAACDAPAEPPPVLPFEREILLSFFESLKDRNFYQMLGLGPHATLKEIRRSYYDLVAQYHPDRRRDVEDKASRDILADIFGLLTEAYETVRSKKRRRLYDRTIPDFTGAGESEEEEALARLFGEATPAEAAAERVSDRPLGWNFYETAVEAFQAGDYQTADLNYKLAVGMDPDRPEYQEGLDRTREIISSGQLVELKKEARNLEDQRKFQEAVVALQKAVELDPVDPEMRYTLARLRFLKTLDRIRAEEDVSWAVALDPNHVDALLLMGRIQAWKGNTDAAVSTFKQVLRIAPGNPKAKQALALFEK